MKGVIEEFAKEKFDLLKSSFTIYCEDKPEGERPGRGITWDKKLFGSEFMGNKPCTVLTTDWEGKPIWIPEVHENELRNDPFINSDRTILSKMNEEQMAYYNWLNEEIKGFERKHLETSSRYGAIGPNDPILSPWTNYRQKYKVGDRALLEVINPKPYSLQEINIYSRNKLERMAFYNNMASAFRNK
jgi:hypothetical protein